VRGAEAGAVPDVSVTVPEPLPAMIPNFAESSGQRFLIVTCAPMLVSTSEGKSPCLKA
jgi:hypothetical protein